MYGFVGFPLTLNGLDCSWAFKSYFQICFIRLLRSDYLREPLEWVPQLVLPSSPSLFSPTPFAFFCFCLLLSFLVFPLDEITCRSWRLIVYLFSIALILLTVVNLSSCLCSIQPLAASVILIEVLSSVFHVMSGFYFRQWAWRIYLSRIVEKFRWWFKWTRLWA